jgi:hypothetical protein
LRRSLAGGAGYAGEELGYTSAFAVA